MPRYSITLTDEQQAILEDVAYRCHRTITQQLAYALSSHMGLHHAEIKLLVPAPVTPEQSPTPAATVANKKRIYKQKLDAPFVRIYKQGEYPTMFICAKLVRALGNPSGYYRIDFDENRSRITVTSSLLAAGEGIYKLCAGAISLPRRAETLMAQRCYSVDVQAGKLVVRLGGDK